MDEILALLKDKPELQSTFNQMVETNKANVAKIGQLETDLGTAIQKRQSIKDLVRNQLGLSEISEDSLKSFANNADEGLKLDNATLQQKLEELTNNYNGLESKHEDEISSMILKDTLRGLGIGDRVQNDRAFSELTKLVLDGAVRDGATFSFKDGDKTKFKDDGQPMTVEDRVIELQSSDFSYLFKPTAGAGGGESKPPQGEYKGQHEKGSVGYIKDKFL